MDVSMKVPRISFSERQGHVVFWPFTGSPRTKNGNPTLRLFKLIGQGRTANSRLRKLRQAMGYRDRGITL
jgi:hypothetical protein